MSINLSDANKKLIRDKLPVIDKRFLTATTFGFGVANYDATNKTNLHISLVCLYDAFRRLEMSITALYRSYQGYVWHKEESDEPQISKDFWAAREGKFYADYVFLLLYATAEDFAAFILHFLEIENEFSSWLKEDQTKAKLERKRISSLQAQVGVFMAENYKSHKITQSILLLRDNEFWNKAMGYRNTWVHEKPPIIEGFGYEYNRKSRLEIGEGYRGFRIGFGSPTDFKVEELIETANKATDICAKVASELLEVLIEKRTVDLGESIDFQKGEISVEIP